MVKTQVGDELSITTSGLGMIDTSFLLLYAVGQFVLTPYGDKLGARRMLCVRQLRRHFRPFPTQFQARWHPTRAAGCDLLGAHADRVLIGACNPML